MVAKNKRQIKILVSSGLLVFFLVLTVIVNSQNTSNPSTNDSMASVRGPASLIMAQIRSGTLYVERQLASKLAAITDRKTASIGRLPDAFENLRFGILEGKYAMTMEGDRIKDVAFIDNPQSEGSPATITDRKKFLKQFASFFDAQSNPERVSVDIKGSKIVETYRAHSSQKDADLLVFFELDELDRLISIQAQKVTRLKLF